MSNRLLLLSTLHKYRNVESSRCHNFVQEWLSPNLSHTNPILQGRAIVDMIALQMRSKA